MSNWLDKCKQGYYSEPKTAEDWKEMLDWIKNNIDHTPPQRIEWLNFQSAKVQEEFWKAVKGYYNQPLLKNVIKNSLNLEQEAINKFNNAIRRYNRFKSWTLLE